MTNQISEDKRDLILKTACELLAKQGFAKTTLDDIAHAIGMKKSSLYYYYTNKDELLDDVMKREENQFYLLAEAALTKSDSIIDKIIDYEKAKFEFVKETIKFHELSTNVFLELKNKLIEHIRRIHTKEIERIKKLLDEGVKNNEIKKCDTKRVAELILTLSEGLRHRELYFASFKVGATIDFKNAIDDMIFAIKLIFNGLSTK